MSEVVRFKTHRTGVRPDMPYFLTDAETRRHGVDIGRAIQSGMLTAEDFREILAFCRDCHEGPAVRREPGHDRLADCAPDWCANRAILEGLRGLV
ncbi:DUF6455 family protein [Defluviimonas aestuarii]|uniref:DUF6455 family protein n=1 Tax=Albidovulum aestuarii TaxID=1130726 RepID=UPI00249AAC29|nr:DUF6455 family protein [Defluviimonas aestuarii]MDI3336549.1 DUF6455 family protein [Defluviimonas aestuarii]